MACSYFEPASAVEGGRGVTGEIEATENPGTKCRQKSCQGMSTDARILASNSERIIVQVGCPGCSDTDLRGRASPPPVISFTE